MYLNTSLLNKVLLQGSLNAFQTVICPVTLYLDRRYHWPAQSHTREFKKTREHKQVTTATAKETSPNKLKGLMRRTIAVHVRYKSLYISSPFSAKQQREMTKFCVFWRTYATTANILGFLYWKWSLALHIQFEQVFRQICALNGFS